MQDYNTIIGAIQINQRNKVVPRLISYNTIIGAIQMRLNKCPTRSVMDRFRIGSSTLICFKNPPMRIVKIITMSIQTRWLVMIFWL